MEQAQLFEQWLAYLKRAPQVPEFLGEPVEAVEAFDPYQMVGEWMALRQEMKQQGKLVQAGQETLRQALELVRSQNEQLQVELEHSRAEATEKVEQQAVALQATQQRQQEREQEKLWKDLLGVMDALDYACDHWQNAEQNNTPQNSITPERTASPSLWRRLASWFARLDPQPEPPPMSDLDAVLESNRQGLELIRRSLLEVLQNRQVTPILATGNPFDTRIMYAIGRQETDTLPENHVYQEVVRGYRWGDRILREAQVIVATKITK